jgi:tetratricopeptide (TPR) repeat protein
MEAHTTESLLEQGRKKKQDRRFKDARSLFRKALDESGETETPGLRATLFAELAYVERTLGELEYSKTHYLLAAQICRQLDHPLRWAHTARHAADILREQGKNEEAELLYTEVLAVYRSHSDANRLDLANAIGGHALLKTQMKSVADARALWEEARQLYRAENIQAGIEECTAHIASLLDRP